MAKILRGVRNASRWKCGASLAAVRARASSRTRSGSTAIASSRSEWRPEIAAGPGGPANRPGRRLADAPAEQVPPTVGEIVVDADGPRGDVALAVARQELDEAAIGQQLQPAIEGEARRI